MKKILGIIVIGLLLSGCLPKVTPSGGTFSGLKVEPDKSRIIILRKGGSLISMDTPAVNISGTTSSSYFLPSKAFIQEDVVAGMYVLEVKKPVGTPLVWRMKPIGIEVVAKKNRTVYLNLFMKRYFKRKVIYEKVFFSCCFCRCWHCHWGIVLKQPKWQCNGSICPT